MNAREDVEEFLEEGSMKKSQIVAQLVERGYSRRDAQLAVVDLIDSGDLVEHEEINQVFKLE
jgi:predicted Ser/Thr protein kinase